MSNTQFITVLLCTATLALTGARVGRATDELEAETRGRLEKIDRGPATIDVAKYPKPIQDSYQVFAKKCAECHTLSRPINANYALPGEWERYLKRMFSNPGYHGIATDATKIFEFLVYDASIRKQAMVQAKLAQATAEDRKAEEERIKVIRAKYDK